jgi:hypothetical protein
LPKWASKFKQYSPPVADVRSVYDLYGKADGKVVYVLAPGPSFEDFPKEVLGNFITIGMNGLLEIYWPDYWIFQEGIFVKKYMDLYRYGETHSIVTTLVRSAFMRQFLPKGRTIYEYFARDHSVLKMPKDTGHEPYWYWPEEKFLPGRSSIASNALSLAVLMRAELIVLVGIDFKMREDQYYAGGIVKNTGPRLKEKALSAGRAWFYLASMTRVWRGPKIITTSATLNAKGIQKVTIDKAIELSMECLNGSTCS